MFKKIPKHFLSHDHEEGQGLIEYALILVLVAVVVIAILLVLGPTVGNVFSNIVANLQRVGIAGPGNSISAAANRSGTVVTVSVTVSSNTTVSVSSSSGNVVAPASKPCNGSCSFNITGVGNPSTGTVSVSSSIGNTSASWN